MRRVACLAVVALALGAGVVDAATKTHDAAFAGQTEQDLPGFVKRLPDGSGVTAAFSYKTTCSAGDGSILWSGVAKAPLKGGHFHYTRKQDAKGPAITLDGTITASGANGIWRIHFAKHDPNGTLTDTCDSGLVNFTLTRDGAGGQLARAYPIALTLGKAIVKEIGVVTTVKCASHTSYVIQGVYDNFRIAKDGTFGKTFTDTTGTPSQGIYANLTLQLHGKLVNGQLQGTWRMKAVFIGQSGKQTDNCDSGSLGWSAIA
jgi:hypothetical protein